MKDALKTVPWQVGVIALLLIGTGILEVRSWFPGPDNVKWSSIGLLIFHLILAIGLLAKFNAARIVTTAYTMYLLLINIVLTIFLYFIEKGFAPAEFPWGTIVYGTIQLGVIIWVFFYLTSDEAVTYFRGKQTSHETI